MRKNEEKSEEMRRSEEGGMKRVGRGFVHQGKHWPPMGAHHHCVDCLLLHQLHVQNVDLSMTLRFPDAMIVDTRLKFAQ